MAISAAARMPRLRPGGHLPLLVGLATPVAVYLFTRHPAALGVLTFAATLPLVAMLRPAVLVQVLIPLFVLGPALPRGTEAAAGAAGVLAVSVAVQVVSGAVALRRAHLWIGLFGLAMLVSFVFPAMRLPSQDSPLFNLLGIGIGLALLAAVVASPPPAHRIAAITAASGAVAAAYTLLLGDDLHGRLQGLTLNPNYLGALLALPLVAAAGLTYTTRKAVWLVPVLLCALALVDTGSRGAMLAAAGGLGILLVRPAWRRQPLLVVVGGAAVLAVATGVVDLGSLLHGRPAAELAYNNDVRATAAMFALDVAIQHPLRGVGYAMFAPYAAGPTGLGIYINTHNDYLRLFAESGAVALALFLVLLWLGLRGRRLTPDLVILRAVVVAYAVGLVFANTLANLTVTGPFWVALGCLTAASTPRTVHDRQ